MISWLWFYFWEFSFSRDLAYILYSVVNVLFGLFWRPFCFRSFDRPQKPLQNLLPFTFFFVRGGDEGTRTPGLCLAKAPLSQLSYIPLLLMKIEELWMKILFPFWSLNFFILHSYFFIFEWAFQDSNLRPRPYQRRALTSWAKSPLDNSEPAEISFSLLLPSTWMHIRFHSGFFPCLLSSST